MKNFCDICENKLPSTPKVCLGCGKKICSSCEYQFSGYCKDCWAENYILAEIAVTVERGHGVYGTRSQIYRTLKKSDMVWRKLMVRFEGKKVKITFEEVKE